MHVGKSECVMCGKFFKKEDLSARMWCSKCEADYERVRAHLRADCALKRCVTPGECRLRGECIERIP